MPKTKEVKETQEFGARIPIETPEVETPKVETPTEDVETIKAEREKLRAELESKDKGLRTAHQTLTKKDEELKRLAGESQRIAGLEERLEIMAALLDRRLASGEVDEGEKVELKKEFARIQEKQHQVEEEAKRLALQEEYYQKANTIYSEAEKVYGDDIDTLHKMRNLIRAGDFDLAEKMIAKVEKKEIPMESEKDKEAKLREQIRKEILTERGELKAESGLPSGASPDDAKIRENYRNKPSDPRARNEYLEYMKRKRGY